MPMLARVVREADLDFREIERVVATVGPGGFTGVRVAVAAARALVLATGAAPTGVTTLDALALEARSRLPELARKPFAVAVDARREMVFFALYQPGLDTAAPELLAAEEAALRVRQVADSVVGSGAAIVAGRIPEHAVRPFATLTDLQPVAANFAQFAVVRAVHPSLKPVYLRPPDAKAQTSFILPRASP